MKLFALFACLFLVAYTNAQTCGEEEVFCEGTVDECIPEKWYCDGIYKDCSNGWDEQDCYCPAGMYQCRNSGVCIFYAQFCDFDRDCPEGEDEKDCPPCPGFMCTDGKCIPSIWACDGEWDCDSDEADCNCNPSEFQCDDGLCIPGEYKCDSWQDCRDKSDESSCTRLAKPTRLASLSKSKSRRNLKKVREQRILSSCSH